MTTAQTRERTIEMPDLLAESGRTPDMGVPLRWIETIVPTTIQRLKAAGYTDSEIGSVIVFGTERLTGKLVDELTPLEVLQDRVAAQDALLAEVRLLRHADGTLVPDAAERLARIAERIGA